MKSPGPFSWYIQYIGIPVSVGFAMFRLFNRFTEQKRQAALQGKVVVITGASSGIGEALAHSFYNYGCKVVLASRRKSELERVKQDLIANKVVGPKQEPVVIELDLADMAQLEPFIGKVHEVCGRIDILINNGGISHRGSVIYTKMDVYHKIMDINYFGAVGLTLAALPKMMERKSGHIVFVSSVQGLIAIPDRSAYAASKHAVQAFGDSLRAEMHQHNINVSILSPGYVKTAVSLNALTGSGDAHGVMDKSTANGFEAEYVALKTVDMIINNDNETIVSQFLPRLAIFLRHAIPSLYFWIMAKRAIKT
ncbi:dehydrogenase/reductase SDR family protein 7-like [Colias croceus]|uniref:dehydrogenase/reductase SDR family protein 7-like n=1 Tax=Colias crocea TaxID=72248 RepID=UPI001E28019E|nr:dehydrogenase/reductase SDR family protein 7-like [Colias croceus]XP_045491417.1 dehydrogenase/reductase SDR family protein 7-like [Colias croceus]